MNEFKQEVQKIKIDFSSPKNCLKNPSGTPTIYREYIEYYDQVYTYLSYRQERLLTTLTGLDSNNASLIDEEWIMKHSKLDKSHYITTRKELCNMGWINYTKEEGKEYFTISINFATIYNYSQRDFDRYKENLKNGVFNKVKEDKNTISKVAINKNKNNSTKKRTINEDDFDKLFEGYHSQKSNKTENRTTQKTGIKNKYDGLDEELINLNF